MNMSGDGKRVKKEEEFDPLGTEDDDGFKVCGEKKEKMS
jgi:hypothetical protein